MAALAITTSITTSITTARQVGASPSSGRIYFRTDRYGGWELASMLPDGSDVQRPTTNQVIKGQPDAHINADGSVKLVFLAADGGGTFRIFTMTVGLPTSYQQLTTGNGQQLRPRWSRDGNRIAYDSTASGNGEIWIMDADGSNPLPIASDPAMDSNGAWSPDGTTLAFSSNRDAHNARGRELAVYLMNTDGSNVRRITRLQSMDAQASFSPDGTKLVFADSVCANNGCGPSHIYLANVDGTESKQLTQGLTNDFHPVFSPGGTKIAFDTQETDDAVRNRSAGVDIATINVDGTGLTNLTSPHGTASDMHPSWA